MKRILSAQTLTSIARFVSLSAVALNLGACSSLQRSNSSGYSGRSEDVMPREERRSSQFDATAESLGIQDPSSLSGSERERVRLRAQLDRGEQFLEGKREREQYFKNKPYIRSDSERIAFLRLPDFETREKWLDAHHISGASTAHNPEVQNLIDQNDVAVGMTKQAVRDSWGEPESIEVAGNPMYGNERWYYTEQVASTEGYRNEKRSIYFESGRVVGWERH